MEKEMKEIWKDIEEYPNYMVSNLGRVKSLNYNGTGREGIMKLNKNKYGYLYISLYKNGVRKSFRVNRLVAKAFIPNSHNLSEVNHIDENKHNNCVDNLEWCTQEYNHDYGTHNERVGAAKRGKHYPKISAAKRGKKLSPEHVARMAAALRGKKLSPEHVAKVAAALRGKYNTKKSKAVQALDENGNVVMEFPSTMEAQRQGFSAGCISQCCRNCYLHSGNNIYKGYIWRFKISVV